MPGVLYMVATPIGNLKDLTERAKEILGSVSLIACEDTRVTRKLLHHLGISKQLFTLHHHSSQKVIEALVMRLKQGESIAYVADAGTPGLADPGGKLVAAAVVSGQKVVPIPGPSAVTAALSVAGLPANLYLFLGYPPHKKGRQKFFKAVAQYEHAVVFFESTHRIIKTLTELADLLKERKVIVCRELTKMFESIYRGSAADVLNQLKLSSQQGEFVVVVAPKK